MNKQKQIEEMAKDIVRSAGLGVYEKAEYLYDLDYRKIHENEVVLTKERFEWLTCCFEKFDEITDDIKELSRKETAKKFADRLKERKTKRLVPVGLDQPAKEVWFIKLTEEDIDEICKEITEGNV